MSLTTPPSDHDGRASRRRTASALARLVCALAGVTFLLIAGLHLFEQFGWRSYYHGAIDLGHDCGYAVVPWTGDWREAQQASTPLTRLPMPYRGAKEPPVVKPDQALVTHCRADLGRLAASDFAWLDLGIVVGESRVYLDGELKAVSHGAGRVGWPLLPTERHDDARVTVVSRGANRGPVGLATLLPPFATADRDLLGRINRFQLAYYGEQPLLRLGMALVVLVVVLAIWFYGLQYADIGWLAVFAALVVLQNGATFAFAFFPSHAALLDRLEAVLNGLIALTAAMVLFAFLRPGGRRHLIERLAVMAALGWTLLAGAASGQIFADLRLLRQTPAVLGIVALAGVWLYAISRSRDGGPEPLARRLRLVKPLAGLGIAFLMGQRLFETTSGVNLAPFAQLGTLIVFGVFLTRDLVVRQRAFLKERELRLAKEAEAKEATMIARTAQMLAHDIRRPFRAVAALTELARQDPDRLRHWSGWHESARQIAEAERYVETMLDELTRLGDETRHTGIVVSVRFLVDKAIGLLSELGGARSAELTIANEVGSDWLVRGSPSLLLRAFYNLLENAAQAMAGRGLITISANIDAVRADLVAITVHNTGTYIEPTEAQAIFGFGHTGRGGTGLGLALVQTVIERHGGTVSVSSAEDLGTSFTVTVPRAFTSATNLVGAGAERSAPQALFGNERPLVVFVDDDWLLTHAIGALLDPWQVLALGSPEEFLAWWDDPKRTESPVAIILDQNFASSSLNGLAVAERLGGRGSAVPLILATNADPRSLATASELVASVVTKKHEDIAKALRLLTGARDA